ncbi:hypothetical protein FMUND_6719 [Fusarium mundagurra]|uniref:Uncharacterized protein n=1 Tax=Fusarium mundagurra TaxID=1567541 RepID=A0A8H6DGG8_9HYPO|nr:hypothetical protein FMUND_6719 [Fusarium mundagurra]
MAPSSAVEAENEPGTRSPTESVFSTVSVDSEAALPNVGRKSLAQEIEDVMERNQNRNEDAQTVAEDSLERAVLSWFLGRQVEVSPFEITMAEIFEMKKRIHKESREQDESEQPELTFATTLVTMIICSLLILAIAHYTY